MRNEIEVGVRGVCGTYMSRNMHWFLMDMESVHLRILFIIMQFDVLWNQMDEYVAPTCILPNSVEKYTVGSGLNGRWLLLQDNWDIDLVFQGEWFFSRCDTKG